MNEKQQKDQQMPIWRIVAVINFPLSRHFVLKAPPFPGQKIKLDSRIPDESRLELDGISVRLRPWPGPSIPEFASRKLEEPAALVFFLAAKDPELAYYEKLEPLLEELLDNLSFQLQTLIYVLRLEALDVTPPVAEGMERYFTLIEYSSPKFLQASRSHNIRTSFYPHLAIGLGSTNTKSRAALRWYVKGMSAHYAVDKFIFFWIALEILRSESGVSVSEPYRARCGHKIPKCPECGEKTSREVLGKSMKKFLIDEAGIERTTAEKLWEFRQILHGSKDLTHEDISDLPQLAKHAREAVIIALKKALDWPSKEPPSLAEPIGPIITNVGIDWSRKKVLDNNDVALGLPDEKFKIK